MLAPLALASPSTAPVSDERRRANVESFDLVWRTVNDNHFDATLGGVDWPAVRDELRPSIESARTMAEARAVLRDMLARLKQTHFEIMAPDGYQDDDPSSEGGRDGTAGLHARLIDGHMVVTRVEPGSSAEKAGARTGWVIRAINGRELGPQVQEILRDNAGSTLLDSKLAWLVAIQLSGRLDDAADVEFLDGRDQVVRLRIPFAQRRGHKTRFSTMPPRYVHFESRLLKHGGADVGYVAFNTWLNPPYLITRMDDAMEEFAGADGVVIDLRGARGGLGYLPAYFAGWFVNRPHADLGTMHLRNGRRRAVVLPHERPFAGRVAILTDGLTRSAGEIFTAGMQDLGRARIFGTRTAGAVLPAKLLRLPNGDSLEYAIANFTSPSGKVLEGNGVEPDVRVVPTRQQLLEGRDPVLEAALEWIASD